VSLHIWLFANKLSLNSAKTSYMLYNNPKINKLKFDFNIKFNNAPLTCSSSVEFLGVIIDENLSFKDHIIKVKKKLSISLFVLAKIRDNISLSIAVQLYYSLFESHLTYCNLLWGNSFTTYLHPLQVLQDKYLKKF
jgi:hypothetical protein